MSDKWGENVQDGTFRHNSGFADAPSLKKMAPRA